ncbi:lytic transglycosylase domain-containing protein [Brassicibacter mesophilus]|uniref:lytic transglycosylase domain-containing protein n=1 Tax=Brassicibacter mesophilus TaxID=745119 RepID=UPI003D256233
MSFETRVKISMILILVFLTLTLFMTVYMIIDIQKINNHLSKLEDNNLELIEKNYNSINETLQHLKQIDFFLNDPAMPQKIASLNKLREFIDLNNKKEFETTIAISNSTPLDLYTSGIIVGYSKKLDLKPSLLIALIEQESNFNKYEVGEHNDRGYCQIIPGTEKWLTKNYGHILDLEYSSNNIFEPEYNIGLGAIYLHVLKKAYGDDYHKILSEYNRGIYNLKKYYERNGTYVTAYSRGILRRENKYKVLNY